MTDNAAEKKEPTATGEIDEILDNIKETMNSDKTPNEDVLELTEKIDSKDELKEPEAANDEPAKQLDEILADDNKEGAKAPEASDSKGNDVINKIDDAHTEQQSAPTQEIQSRPTQKAANSDLVHNDIANESRKALQNLIEKTEQDDSLIINRDTTLEQLTKELLKPQLSEWLNNNLQAIVEKVVQKEIRKILPND